MKVKVLRVAKSLRSKDQWKQVYISADETKREREKSTAGGTTGQARKW